MPVWSTLGAPLAPPLLSRALLTPRVAQPKRTVHLYKVFFSSADIVPSHPCPGHADLLPNLLHRLLGQRQRVRRDGRLLGLAALG